MQSCKHTAATTLHTTYLIRNQPFEFLFRNDGGNDRIWRRGGGREEKEKDKEMDRHTDRDRGTDGQETTEEMRKGEGSR